MPMPEAGAAHTLLDSGDVIGKIDLTPVAIAAGRLLADRLFAGAREAESDWIAERGIHGSIYWVAGAPAGS